MWMRTMTQRSRNDGDMTLVEKALVKKRVHRIRTTPMSPALPSLSARKKVNYHKNCSQPIVVTPRRNELVS